MSKCLEGGTAVPKFRGTVSHYLLRTKIISKTINLGRQGKHIIGHNNFKPGKSILTRNAQKLLDAFHKGSVRIVRTLNNKVIVDFGDDIGVYYNQGTKVGKTRFGIIHHGKKGAHIVPANPIQY